MLRGSRRPTAARRIKTATRKIRIFLSTRPPVVIDALSCAFVRQSPNAQLKPARRANCKFAGRFSARALQLRHDGPIFILDHGYFETLIWTRRRSAAARDAGRKRHDGDFVPGAILSMARGMAVPAGRRAYRTGAVGPSGGDVGRRRPASAAQVSVAGRQPGSPE